MTTSSSVSVEKSITDGGSKSSKPSVGAKAATTEAARRRLEKVKNVKMWRGISRSDSYDVHRVGDRAIREVTNDDGTVSMDRNRQWMEPEKSSWASLNIVPGFRRINPPVFIPTAVIIILFCCVFGARPDLAVDWFIPLKNFISDYFGWFYLLSCDIILITITLLACSKLGHIKLGSDTDEPEFSFLSWTFMCFTAVMGIGLIFFSVAEPVSHAYWPPNDFYNYEQDRERAVPLVLFNWGLHYWATYAHVGLIIGYYSARLKLPVSFRACFYPLLGKWTMRWPGHCIDVLAMVGTIFGLATGLGLGCMQIVTGMNFLSDSIPNVYWVQCVVILSITTMGCISLVLGLSSGVRVLANVTMYTGFGLMFTLWFVNDGGVGPSGSTQLIMDNIVGAIGSYGEILLERSFRTGAFDGAEKDWTKEWTVYYFAWLFCWCPFIGCFLAKISKGRTVREYVMVTVFLCTMMNAVWFTVFGTIGVSSQEHFLPIGVDPAEYCAMCPAYDLGVPDSVSCWESNNANGGSGVNACPLRLGEFGPDLQIYLIYKYMWQQRGVVDEWVYKFFSSVTIAIVGALFVSSSDSASMVVDLLGNGGLSQTPRIQKVFWAYLEGLVAIILLGAGSGLPDKGAALAALQALVVALGLPIAALMLICTVGLIKTMVRDPYMATDVTNIPKHPGRIDAEDGGFEAGPSVKTKSSTSLSCISLQEV